MLKKIMKKIILVLAFLMFSQQTIIVQAAETDKEKFVEGDFEYIVSGEEAILSKYLGKEENVVVPSELNGYPVVWINQGAFMYNHAIKTITFSEGLLGMSPESIAYCNELTKIYLPASFGSSGDTVGGGGSIYGCNKISEVVVAEGNKALKLHEGVLYTYDMETLIFYPPGNTREVYEIPEGVKTISSDSFRDNAYIKEIIMPDTVTFIGYWAFIHDTSLEKLYISKNCEIIGQFAIQGTAIKELEIPASVTWIMTWGIFDNIELEKIIVDENNPVYYSEDGVLYTDNILVVYPENKENTIFQVPDGIVEIYSGAFYGVHRLEEIILPDTVKLVDDQAFMNCGNLQKINLPDGIEKIGALAFGNDVKLENAILPNSLTIVTSDLLNNFQSVVIQENVTKILKQLFVNCNQEIYFMGDAPKGIENLAVDSGYEYTIYYPSDNNTWDDVISKYSWDNVTWKEINCKKELKKYSDGNWYYYICDKVHTGYTGMAKNPYGWWYVKNGKLDVSYTGFAENPYGTWYMKNGKLVTNANGLINVNGAWYYVKNGELCTTYTGLVKYKGNWVYVNKGKLDASYTGLVKYNKNWVYVSKGKLNSTYTGLVKYNTNWVYVNKGKLDASYTGLVKYKSNWVYVNKGKLDTSFTGMAKNPYGWWYVTKGKLDHTYTGIAKNAYGTWYLQKGKLDLTFSGKVTVGGKTYTVKNGKVK